MQQDYFLFLSHYGRNILQTLLFSLNFVLHYIIPCVQGLNKKLDILCTMSISSTRDGPSCNNSLMTMHGLWPLWNLKKSHEHFSPIVVNLTTIAFLVDSNFSILTSSNISWALLSFSQACALSQLIMSTTSITLIFANCFSCIMFAFCFEILSNRITLPLD